MSNLISFLILFGLGSILVVGIGIAIQLSRRKNKQQKESDNDIKVKVGNPYKIAVEQITKADR